MSPQQRLRKIRHARWTLIFFGIGLVATMAVYVTLHDQQNRDRSDARSSAALGATKVTSSIQKIIAFRHNSIVCVMRPYLEAAVTRQRQAEDDTFLPEEWRERQHQARITSQVTLRGLVTVPPSYNCDPLLAKLGTQVHRAES